MMGVSKTLSFAKLTEEHASTLFMLFKSAPSEYSKWFVPFKIEEVAIHSMLKRAERDRYEGMFLEGELAGFYMLRGFDEGFTVPSYGVWVAPQYSGLGLATQSLSHVIAACRANGVSELMLKVHPQNTVAKKLYESFGFEQSGVDPKNQNLVYKKDLGTQKT